MSETDENEHRRGRPPPPATACERAWQLRESGRYGSIRAIRQQLAEENPDWYHASDTTTTDWIKRGQEARAAELAFLREPIQHRDRGVAIREGLIAYFLTALDSETLTKDDPALMVASTIRMLLADVEKLVGANAAAKLDATISRGASAGVLADTRDRIMASNGALDGGDVMAATRASYARRQLRAVGSTGASDTDAPGGTDDLDA